MRRSLVETLERRKDSMIAALWANSNYDGQGDDKPSPRPEIIEEIESNYDEAVERILTGWKPEEEEDELDEDNPFFAPVKRAMRKLEQPRNDEGKVADVVGEDYTSIDQS